MPLPSSPRSFRVFGRVAGRLIALGSLIAVVASGCSDGVRTEPGFCPTGGNAGAGGCGGSCGQNSLGGGGADTGAMGGAPASGGQSAGGSAGGESQGGSPQAGEAGTGGEPQAGADSGGAAGDSQGGAGGDAGSGAKGGASGNAGSGAKGGASGNAGSGAKGGAGGNAGSGAKGGAGGNAGSGAKGGAGGNAGSSGKGGGGGSGCPQTIKNATSDTSKAQDQVCEKAYSVDECGKACAQITPAACLACELASADCAPTTDCDFATGVAQGGPAGGAPRAELCREAMECFRTSNCGKVSTDLCYCGTSGATCYSGGANGLCKAQIEAGLETELGSEIASRFGEPIYGAGLALLRLTCDRDICKAECFLP